MHMSMPTSVCTCPCTCVCTYLYTCACVWLESLLHTLLCTFLYGHVCAHAYAHVLAHVYAHICTCAHANACACTCLYTCACTCLHAYVCTLRMHMSAHMTMHMSKTQDYAFASGLECQRLWQRILGRLMTGDVYAHVYIHVQARRVRGTPGHLLRQRQQSRHKSTPSRASLGCASFEMSQGSEMSQG